MAEFDKIQIGEDVVNVQDPDIGRLMSENLNPLGFLFNIGEENTPTQFYNLEVDEVPITVNAGHVGDKYYCNVGQTITILAGTTRQFLCVDTKDAIIVHNGTQFGVTFHREGIYHAFLRLIDERSAVSDIVEIHAVNQKYVRRPILCTSVVRTHDSYEVAIVLKNFAPNIFTVACNTSNVSIEYEGKYAVKKANENYNAAVKYIIPKSDFESVDSLEFAVQFYTSPPETIVLETAKYI